jgi:hypothetical protein
MEHLIVDEKISLGLAEITTALKSTQGSLEHFLIATGVLEK